MAGGTGGHIMPGLAIAEQLQARGWTVRWLGTAHGMENRLVPAAGIALDTIAFSGLRGKGLLHALRGAFQLLGGFISGLRLVGRVRPDVALGMGGYVTVPGGLTAALLRLPLVIHEQNSVAGLSNRLLGRFARRVLSGFPQVLPNAEWCGNPVRDNITALRDPEQRYAARSGKLNVLVVGGSLGAKGINECVPQALARLPEDARPDVLHQSGRRHFEAVHRAYQYAGVQPAAIQPFLDNIAFFYDQADLVICRAGALTVAELAAAGVASILIPFPFAVDDHQTYNARYLSERGAALLLPQKDLTPQRLADLIGGMTRERALEMAQAARAAAMPDATKRVAEVCKEAAGL